MIKDASTDVPAIKQTSEMNMRTSTTFLLPPSYFTDFVKRALPFFCELQNGASQMEKWSLVDPPIISARSACHQQQVYPNQPTGVRNIEINQNDQPNFNTPCSIHSKTHSFQSVVTENISYRDCYKVFDINERVFRKETVSMIGANGQLRLD